MKKILRYLKNLRSYFSTMRNDVFYHLGCPVDKEVVGTIAVKHTNNMPPKVDNVDPNGESNEDYPEDEQYEEENASLETQAVEDLLEGQMEYLTLNCADGAQLIKGSSKNFDYDILDISMTGLTNNINMLEGMIPNLEQAIKVIEDFAKTSYLDHSRQTEATKVVSKLSSLFKMSDNGTRYFTERINVLIDFDMNLISQLGVFEDHLSNWLKVSKNVMKNLKLDSAVDTEADLNTAVIQSYTNLKTLANITKDRHIKAIKMLKTFIDGGYNEDSPIFSRVDWKYDAGPSYTEILTTKNDEGETSWLSNIWNAGKKLVSDTGKLLKVSHDPQVKIDALNDLIHHRDRMLNGWKLFPDQSSEKLSGLVSDKSSYQYFLARLCFQSMYWANQEDQQLVDRACEGVVMETKAVSGKLGYKRSEALKKMLRLEYRQIKARFKTPEKRACIMRNFRRNNKAAEFMGQLNLK